MKADQTKAPIEPIVKSIVVAWPPETAFRRFTREIGSWWPLETHSLFGDKTVTVTMEGHEGGRLFETSVDGETRLWGSVTTWQPSELVAFTWHLDRDPATTQRIEVRFTPEPDGGTRVELTHLDWHVFGAEAAEHRGYYANGWDGVLGRYTSDPG